MLQISGCGLQWIGASSAELVFENDVLLSCLLVQCTVSTSHRVPGFDGCLLLLIVEWSFPGGRGQCLRRWSVCVRVRPAEPGMR